MSGHSEPVRSRPLARRKRSFFNSAGRSPPFPRCGRGWPRSPPSGRATASLERAVVGQGAAYRRAVALHDLRLRVAPALDLALDRSDPTYHLLQLFLGMPVGLKDRQGGFAQIVEMAQLVRHVGPDLANGKPDRMLAVADHADDRNPKRGQFRRDLAQQTGEIGADSRARASRTSPDRHSRITHSTS